MAEEKCSVCGASFSLWARLAGDAADRVCKACEEEGIAKLEGVSVSVAPNAVFTDIIELFNNRVVEYHVPEGKAAPIRHRLVDQIVAVTAEKERVTDDDVHLMNKIGKMYPAPRELLTDRRISAAARINCRNLIENWNAADPPVKECSGLLLQDEEVCRWEEPARMFEQRTRREYVGASHGFSIPLARGIRYRVSAFKGTPIDTAYLSDCGAGTLHVTSNRVCFTGSQQSAAVQWKKIINVAVFSDGFAIHRIGAKKPTVLQVNHTDLTLEILALASPAKND